MNEAKMSDGRTVISNPNCKMCSGKGVVGVPVSLQKPIKFKQDICYCVKYKEKEVKI